MGILDKSPRHNSARAKTDVVLQAIPRSALTVYGEHGAGRMATVTERSLIRAENQMKDASDKQTVDPAWAQSFNITDSDDVFDWDAFLDGSSSDDDSDISQVA
jgi:CRP-like cAMP-binding protein